MEYVQMTLDDWFNIKQKLNQELLGVKRSFVKIGYFLRKIEESEGYKNDGYKSIAEFAKTEYGLEHSTVSRFMAINREYSVDGYSEHLLPEYEEYKRSQLEEMLKLPAEDRTMINPDTPRADIRELKKFNKEVHENEGGLLETIEKFFLQNEETLHTIYREKPTEKKMVEMVNPSGNRTFRNGKWFLMLREDCIKYKEFPNAPKEMKYEELFQFMRDIFGSEQAQDAPNGFVEEVEDATGGNVVENETSDDGREDIDRQDRGCSGGAGAESEGEKNLYLERESEKKDECIAESTEAAGGTTGRNKPRADQECDKRKDAQILEFAPAHKVPENQLNTESEPVLEEEKKEELTYSDVEEKEESGMEMMKKELFKRIEELKHSIDEELWQQSLMCIDILKDDIKTAKTLAEMSNGR